MASESGSPPRPPALFDLSDKIALVTGGSRGLGRSTVLGLAHAGCDVIVASRKLDNCETVARLVEEQTGRRALAYGVHVGHWDELDGLVDAAYDAFGRVDVLVNNAGMSPLYDGVLDISEKLFDTVVGINLKGPFRLSALVGTRMAEGDGGSIINISTIGSIHPRRDIIPYAASKAGLNAMTIAMADALGPRVRVNCVMPGAFRTDVTKAWAPATFEAVERTTALRRMGEPDDIVGTIIYLASDASAYTTGAVFPVHGGSPA